MTALREKYISYMRYRNYSVRTINQYSIRLIELAKHYNLSPEALDREQFLGYMYYLVEKKQVSTVYLNQLISAFKILIVEVLRMDWEAYAIRRPMPDEKLPDVLSQGEV